MMTLPKDGTDAINPAARRALALALALLIALMTSLSAADAAPIIRYQFSSDATMTDGGAVLDIAGFFDYDVGLAAPADVDLTVSNGSNSEGFNTITNTGACQNSTKYLCAEAPSGDIIGIAFLNSLALGSMDPLYLPDTGCDCSHVYFLATRNATAVTGSAEPVIAQSVPEPTSLLVFGSAVVGCLVLRLRRYGIKQMVLTGLEGTG